MRQRKSNIAYWSRLGLTILLLMMSLVLTIGTAWGRYRTELDKAVYLFQPKEISRVYLWGKEGIDGYEQLPGTWTLTNSGNEMPFIITNGTSHEDYTSDDLDFNISVVVMSGVQGDENLMLYLQLDEDETIYQAVATEIEENSVMYKQVGPGWIYRFYDQEGEEFSGVLEGGALSEFSAKLICEGFLAQPDSSLLQIQVTAANSN